MPAASGPGQRTAANQGSRAGPADRAAAGQAGDPGGVLGAEREHLHRSRQYLRQMREDVLGLRAMAGDRVSEEYLKATLYARAQALADLPDTPLFFGRLDFAAGAGPDGLAGENFHIGRRHVHDPDGRPAVIDWRAPVSRAFYRASQAEPMGLARRRRFGFAAGELSAFEDETFLAAAQDGQGKAAAAAPVSQILIDEIERPRSGPMRDIVATIQPDQDDIVRAEADQTVCVQGAPGTGKTAVGLHRIAYLLYANRERMSRGGVLVVGPNRGFLAYIRDVLPALGEVSVSQVTVTDLLTAVPVRAADTLAAARVKSDDRMAEVLRRALWAQLVLPAEAITLPRGARRWRVSGREIDYLVAGLRERGVRYGTGREMLGHRIAHVILTKMEAAGETCDDRTHEAVRRTRQVRAAVNAIWPKTDPVRLVIRLLSDPELLAAAAAGLLDPAEQEAISWRTAPRGPASAPWSPADAVLVDEAADLMERTPSLAHVVVDEAQDLSPMECRAIGRRCATGSATVLGDLAQGTTPWAAASWPQLLAHLGKQDTDVRELEVGYRVPRQILDFASRLLAHIAPGLAAARSLRADPGALEVIGATEAELAGLLTLACQDALTRPGSVAVIAADDQVQALAGVLRQAGLAHAVLDDSPDRETLVVVPVTLAKGLEFDHVIVVEPALIAAAEARGLHRLYVALTRAVSRLTVLHARPLPEQLRAA
ncbi:MAG TPA: ATP-binding domain-containing protein [Streptosporangiaceae bacterium]|jgi:DNA helicase IV